MPETTRAPAESPGDRRYPLYQRLAAGTVLLFGVVVALTSLGYGLTRGKEPGPGLFPFVIGTLLALLALVWLWRPGVPEHEEAVPGLAEQVEDSGADLAPADEELSWTRDGVRRFGLTIGLTAATVGLFVSVGYVIAMAFYAATLLILVARQRMLWSILGAIVGAVASRYLFDYLGIVLPSLPVDLPWKVL
ncbi:tripartite tricarboxylate transporter TctB family protein [Kribbella sp. NPDC049227]|uniref:tripartite tricarboxylate transporter TctB family protein n=1 Tax=Kribbella sp. NPDC049227 TaxID=3364113 RepID=UPI003720A3D4